MQVAHVAHKGSLWNAASSTWPDNELCSLTACRLEEVRARIKSEIPHPRNQAAQQIDFRCRDIDRRVFHH